MSLLILACILCLLSTSQALEIRNLFDESTRAANVSKPEIRSLPSAFKMLLGNFTNPKGFKKSFLRDLILEIIDPGPPFICDLNEFEYPIIRGVLADKLLRQNVKTYKDFSVVSSKEKQPLLYQPLLERSIPSTPDVRFVENPLSAVGKFEDHNLKRLYCVNKDAPEGLGSKFYKHFTTVLMPDFPEKLQEAFNIILNQRHRLLDMYKIMKKLANNRVTHPSYKKINSIIQPAIDDMQTIKDNAKIDYSAYKEKMVELMLASSKFNVNPFGSADISKRILNLPILTPVLPAGSDAKYTYFQNFINRMQRAM